VQLPISGLSPRFFLTLVSPQWSNRLGHSRSEFLQVRKPILLTGTAIRKCNKGFTL